LQSGSKEEESTKHWTSQIYQELNRHQSINDSIMVDDRTNLTIGKRLLEAKRMGYPLVIVVGAKAADPTSPHFEYHNLVTNQQIDFSYSDLLSEIIEFVESANKFI
jgi:prolyl-tRNA synthetase